MLAKVLSGTTIGLEGVLITVEVDVAERGFPGFTIVGLPDKSIDESKERVRAAIINTSFEMPDTRLTVNLAPADIQKMGSAFDLPIAVGILTAAGMIKKEAIKRSLFLGELSLEGELKKIPGVLPVSILAENEKIEKIYVPLGNANEASLVDSLEIYPIKNLSDLILHLNGEISISCFPRQTIKENVEDMDGFLFENIKGQASAKRACEIAAAGFHNLIFKGPPGTGKTLLSKAFSSILPPMEKEEVLEVTKVYSVAGLLKDKFYISRRPFRSPHHTTSRIGLVGGGSSPNPGEISLAHRGVLFLDEFSEFPRSVLEALRQPLEDGEITVSRAQRSLTFPCRFLLLAASNPCPCGYLGHPKKPCHCFPGAIIKYKKRLSGPLLDRIDLHVDVPPVDENDLVNELPSESSRVIRDRVIRARKIQKKRFKGLKIFTNGEMGTSEIKKYCVIDKGATELLKKAISRLSLSARSYFKTIKIAQTITDLNERNVIETQAVAEALQYRSHDE